MFDHSFGIAGNRRAQIAYTCPVKSMLKTAVFVLAALLSTDAQAAGPAEHAHNDYEHRRPLLDALDHGFTSVEADIWLRGGELLIGHDEIDLDPARTLERLYLEPLRRLLADRSITAAAPLVLLIDIKTEGEATYNALSAVLSEYVDILARVEQGQLIAGPVMAIVSGNRPRAAMAADDPRHAFYDGRLADLDSGLPPSFMPLVSDNWARHFSWRGEGEMPPNEWQTLVGLAADAHAKGYRLRFWATPDRPGPARDALWRALSNAGVDFINTDDLAGYAAFRDEGRQP
jgi:hypothetical protein